MAAGNTTTAIAMNATPSGETSSGDRLEVHDDLEFQRKTWRFERIGWAVMGLIVLAALLGLTGSGWLSQTIATNAQLRVEYDRFLRMEAPVVFKLHIGPASVSADAVVLRVDAAFVEDFDIERVVPEPAAWRLTPEGAELRFAASGEGPLGVVNLRLQPQRYGPGTATIGLADQQPPVRLRYFVYP